MFIKVEKNKEAKCRCQLKPAEDHCFIGLCFLLRFAINIFQDFRHVLPVVPGVPFVWFDFFLPFYFCFLSITFLLTQRKVSEGRKYSAAFNCHGMAY